MDDREYEKLQKKLRRRGRWIKPVILVFILLLLVLGVVRVFVLGFATMTDDSMFPAIINGDEVVVYRWASEFQRGDLVLFMEGERPLLRRVVAVAGDVVQVKKGQLVINDEPVETERGEIRKIGILYEGKDQVVLEDCLSYTEALGDKRHEICIGTSKRQTPKDLPNLEVPNGHVFTLCDFRSCPGDSRHFGPVPEAAIIGRVDYMWCPVEREKVPWYQRWFGVWDEIE